MANEEYLSPDGETSTELTEASPSTLAIITQSEYAAMVATANIDKNKRNIEVFSKKLMAYATHSQPVALSMFYTLPRAGKQIVGPSVRYAEVVAPCWKNNSTGSRMIGNTEDTITAQGVFIDYEFNTRNIKEIPRRITNSQGQKFNSDMILTTGKAALSIAYREAVLKGGVPMALWNPAYEQAKLTAVGSAVSHAARIDAAMEYLTKLGVSEWQIMNAVGVTSPKELEIDHLVTLKALCEEIKKGVRTIEDVFGSPFDKEIESLFKELGKNITEQTFVRKQYMGRAKDLLEYLRGRLAPTGQTVGKQTQEQKPAEQAEKQASQTEASTEKAKTEEPKETEVKRPRGRPKKMPSEKADPLGPEDVGDDQEDSVQQEVEPAQDEKPEQQADPAQGKVETGKFQF